MKQLLLVRHAKTEPIEYAGTDFERELKARGRSDSELVAKYMKQGGYTPGVIVTSSAFRARQTAHIMASVFEIPLEEIMEARFIYDGFDAVELLTKLQRVARHKDSMMVVGHNPDIALTAMQLAAGNFFHFPTAAVAVINFDVGHWSDIGGRVGQTELFITPKELRDKK